MIKKLAIGLGGVLGVLVLALGGLLVASELEEVVILHTQEEDGSWYQTRLWVVDYGNKPWLRAGEGERPWLAKVRANRDVRLERDGQMADYNAMVIPLPATRLEIDRAMRTKYGWIDAAIMFLEGAPVGTPVRLDPR